jgi:integral membrane protein
MNSIRNLRLVAVAEATTFLALLVAVYFRYQEHQAGGVHVLGPIHGVLFLAYLFLAYNVREDRGWPAKTFAWVLLGAVLPFGGYVVDRWLARRPLASTA